MIVVCIIVSWMIYLLLYVDDMLNSEFDMKDLVTRYSDSDYAADVDIRWFVNGYEFTLGGSKVSWKSTL